MQLTITDTAFEEEEIIDIFLSHRFPCPHYAPELAMKTIPSLD